MTATRTYLLICALSLLPMLIVAVLLWVGVAR